MKLDSDEMRETFVLTDVDGELVATLQQADARPADDTPFRVLLIGDWSGRANRSLFASSEELRGWRPLFVDRDNLDLLIAKLGTELRVPGARNGSVSLTISFNKLADFHPDRIFDQLELFRAFRETRARLQDPETFATAARDIRNWGETKTNEPSQESTKDMEARSEATARVSGGSLLDQILEAKPGKPRASLSEHLSPEIKALVQEAVKPYLVSVNEMEQEQLLAVVDGAVSKQMRDILHNPDFQALESAWRALDFLVSRLNTGSEIKLYILDISRREFESDLSSVEGDESTATFKLLVEDTVDTPGAVPWAAIVANYTFDCESKDITLLERISRIARRAGASFLAAASPRVLGGESFPELADSQEWRLAEADNTWKKLAASSAASYLGLALPRFLLRLPYGSATEPTEGFSFEEMPEDIEARHESYLWANPTFAVVYVLARAFANYDWNFSLEDVQDIDGLPLHIFTHDGETEVKPCAEILMTVRGAEKIIERGLIPLISIKETDTVRVGILQSVAGTRLAGRWDKAT